MPNKVERSRQSVISLPFAFKRATTLISSTDSFTSSSSSMDGSAPCREDKTRVKQRRENQRRIDDSSKTNNRKSTIPLGRRRRLSCSAVSFGDTTVREYNRSLGDWWDVQNGLGLGWEYIQHPSVPLPYEDNDVKKQAWKPRKKQVKKLKGKIDAWFLLSRKKRNSIGSIDPNAVVNLDRNNQSRKKDCYEDNKPTAKVRGELLKQFGFTSEELNLSEAERKLLHMEYKLWTQTTDSNRRSKPSDMFSERFLAGIRAPLPTGTITATATDTETSRDATTTATTTVTITPTTVTTTTTAVTTTADGETTTTTTTDTQQ